jgi:hypothetical protein
LLKAESLLAQTKGQLRRFGLRARKGLGQHFLIDEGVLKLIASSAELTASDVVIEVGSWPAGRVGWLPLNWTADWSSF